MDLALHTISFSIIGGIGRLELMQPPANRMTAGFFSDFNEMTDRVRTMTGLEALVISSTGRHFSSGADLDELLDEPGAKEDGSKEENGGAWLGNFERNYRSFLFYKQAGFPVIAAIRGVCIGSAFELALCCHFRFCGEDAVFGLPETTFNLMPGLGGIRHMEEICGQAKAMELVLKGNTFGSDEALRHHLVDKIVPKRQVVDFSMAFAAKVKKNYQKQKAPLYLQQITVNDTNAS
jgi:enoyl-CoA hydratase